MLARPEDILVFMDAHFLREHTGSRLPGRVSLVAAPSSVKGSLSHLSTLFDHLGRRGPYDPVTGLGNPCDSTLVRNYKQGYTRDLWKAGFQEISAVPLTYSKVTEVVDHIDGQLVQPRLSPFRQLCLARDALLMLYCWDSGMRGKEGGQVSLQDLHHPNGTQIFPRGLDPEVLLGPVPNHLLVLPTHGTKTNRKGRIHQDPIHLTRKDNDRHCFVSRLWCYLILALLSDVPMVDYLFRPQTAQRTTFANIAYSSSSVNQMLQGYLTAIGDNAGETGHSFRRGTLQATASATEGPLGVLAAALQGRIKTPAVLQKYLDPNRHLGRYCPY